MSDRRTGGWQVRLTSAAETDFERILQWTAERFGRKQAHDYAQILLAARDARRAT